MKSILLALAVLGSSLMIVGSIFYILLSLIENFPGPFAILFLGMVIFVGASVVLDLKS